MSFDISTGAVIGVLNEVNPKLEGYEKLFTTFSTELEALATACKAEPIGAELASLAVETLQPAMTNIAGRTGNAVSAVNNVVTILTSADQAMSDTARESAAKAAQEKADDAPALPPASDPNKPQPM